MTRSTTRTIAIMKNRLIRILAAACLVLLSPARAEPKQEPDLKVSILGQVPHDQKVVVRFENHSSKPIRLLSPLDGSGWGWHLPFYEITLSNDKGEKIPLGLRCGLSGLYSSMKWPDDYRIQILPGHAYEMPVGLCREIPSDGLYTVTFRYIYDSKAETIKKDPAIQYPADLWTGIAEAPPKEIHLSKVP